MEESHAVKPRRNKSMNSIVPSSPGGTLPTLSASPFPTPLSDAQCLWGARFLAKNKLDAKCGEVSQ